MWVKIVIISTKRFNYKYVGRMLSIKAVIQINRAALSYLSWAAQSPRDSNFPGFLRPWSVV